MLFESDSDNFDSEEEKLEFVLDVAVSDNEAETVVLIVEDNSVFWDMDVWTSSALSLKAAAPEGVNS